MQIPHFEEAIEEIIEHDDRYDFDAYLHLKDSLDFAVKKLRDSDEGARHVDALELLHGVRDFTLEQYGPMSATLLEEWGITSCNDIGEMVYQLIECGMFGKQESDRRDAFNNPFDLKSDLEKPFLPKKLQKVS